MQTLSELRAENESANGQTEEELVINDPVEEELEQDENSEAVEDEAEEGAESAELDWLKEDDDSASNSVPVAKHVEVKHKLKARLSEKDERIAELERKLEEATKPVAKKVESDVSLAPPTLEQFDYDNEQYQAAMAKWASDLVESKLNSTLSTQEQEQQAKKAKADLDAKVNGHYERVSGLVEGGVITADVYKASETAFRRSVMQASGYDEDAAEQLSDVLISRIGEGSEKIIPYLGRNKQAQTRFVELMKSDPSGLDLMLYIGELKAKFGQAKTVKPTQTIQPDEPLSGAGGKPNEKALKAAYTKAQNSGDAQKAWDLKKQAKAAGINSNNW